MDEDEELTAALQLIETERTKLLKCQALPVDDIISMGSVEYITKHLPLHMKKVAHNCSMPDREVEGHSQLTTEITPLNQAYKVLWLKFFEVQKYLDEVFLHIKYVQVLGEIIYPNHKDLQHRFAVHDCSKFSFEEVYGYVLKWTHEVDGPEWKVSLDHHLLSNDHHPEFYKGEAMEKLPLIESAVDMLSWRLIKNRCNYPGQQVQDWLFDVEDKYLERYVEGDRRKVSELLTEWKNAGFKVSHL